MKIPTYTFLLATMSIAGCRTLDPEARSVRHLDRPPNNCKNLGPVNVDWAYWGASTEVLNVMKNQTAQLGGNSLLPQAGAIGIAYQCPAEIH